MSDDLEISQESTITINPPGERENMISVIDAVKLTRKADDLCHNPEKTASTSLSDIQESVAPEDL